MRKKASRSKRPKQKTKAKDQSKRPKQKTKAKSYHYKSEKIKTKKRKRYIKKYILILPSFGIISEIVNSKENTIFGRIGLLYAIYGIGVVGLIVWAHHSFIVGMDYNAKRYFTITTIIIGLPTGLKIFSWIISLKNIERTNKNKEEIKYVEIFIILFTIGGVTGISLASSIIDISIHDTIYVVGHFHYQLGISIVVSIVIGIKYYVKRIIEKEKRSEVKDNIIAISLSIGVMLIFMPMFRVGMNGQSRRYIEYNPINNEINNWMTNGVVMVLITMTIYLISIIEIIVKGQKAIIQSSNKINKKIQYKKNLEEINIKNAHNWVEKPIV